MDPIKILIPVDERTDAALLALAADLLGGARGTLLLLAVVEMPLGRHPVSGAASARAARHALRRLAATPELSGISVEVRVRAARRRTVGVREVADEERPDLLLLAAGPGGSLDETGQALLAMPPCDIVVARPGAMDDLESVLVPARGGPTAERALAIAVNLASRRGARITLLHLDLPGMTLPQREHELRLFSALLGRCDYPRLRSMAVPAAAAEPALLTEAARHQVVVLGASGNPDAAAGDLLGPLPQAMLAAAPGTVLVVKPRRTPDASVFVPRPPVDVTVDKWFVENSFHCREFADIEELVRARRSQQLAISVVVLPSGDAAALPAILRLTVEELGQRLGLIDEVIVVVPNDVPAAAEAARTVGAAICRMSTPIAGDRGRAMRASLDVARGDIIVWLDGDIRNFHPRFLYGLVGPLLREPRVVLVTGFHGSPDTGDDVLLDEGQEQITELVVRPLINLYFPELSGLVNPLARERAVRREALTGLRLLSGLGVDIAMLLDIYEQYGLWAIAQTDLEERIGRREHAREVTRRAFATVQALVGRLPPSAREATCLLPASMKLIHRQAERYHIEVVDMTEASLPPVRAHHTPAKSKG